MRSRLILLTLSICLTLAVLGCTSKPAADNSASDPNQPTDASNTTEARGGSERSANERREPKKRTIVVPAGTTVTVSLGSALGSKLSQSGQTFNGTVAKDVIADNEVVVPRGAAVTGTVTDAKALGKFAGGATLQLRLESITLNGRDVPVQAAARTFSVKGKGKRTAVMAGGGAALGGIIGALAGGGKGAAIGMAAGGGAGAGGAAFTGNKEIVLPAESDVSFELTQPLDIR
jgi:hypothetical protein